MDIDKLINDNDVHPGNFSISRILDNVGPEDKVCVKLQSGPYISGTVRLKNSKTIALRSSKKLWVLRMDMIAGVGVPLEEMTAKAPVSDERDTNKVESLVSAYEYKCSQCGIVMASIKKDIMKVGGCPNCGSNAWFAVQDADDPEAEDIPDEAIFEQTERELDEERAI